ncbi:hypothetical protein Tco_1555926 [Tanacetum coccineum]
MARLVCTWVGAGEGVGGEEWRLGDGGCGVVHGMAIRMGNMGVWGVEGRVGHGGRDYVEGSCWAGGGDGECVLKLLLMGYSDGTHGCGKGWGWVLGVGVCDWGIERFVRFERGEEMRLESLGYFISFATIGHTPRVGFAPDVGSALGEDGVGSAAWQSPGGRWSPLWSGSAWWEASFVTPNPPPRGYEQFLSFQVVIAFARDTRTPLSPDWELSDVCSYLKTLESSLSSPEPSGLI